MITFTLNSKIVEFTGDPKSNLLVFLRNTMHLTAAKDGCSGQGVCGACSVEVDGKIKMACRTKMGDIEGSVVFTLEGLDETFRKTLGRNFALRGAVQCGFCSPGMIMRAKGLYNQNPKPSRNEIIRAITPNLCRCTGYVKIIDAIDASFKELAGELEPTVVAEAKIGERYPKYQAEATALGERPFVDDLRIDGMLFGALKFSDHPRAEILSIDVAPAMSINGVVGIYTAKDIPGNHFSGLVFQDWPLMVGKGETTHYIGDVVASVVATTEETARKAVEQIRVTYRVFSPVTDIHQAILPNSPNVHTERSNVLETCTIRFGEVKKAFEEAAYISSDVYETQRIEHAFLETETALALPDGDGVKLYSQGQGVYIDRSQIAKFLDIPEEKVKVVQVQNGGGFGGKEDLTVQGHAALCAYLSGMPIKIHLNREESLRMHPKRHPVWMKMSLACNSKGKFTALKLDAIGDTGAYASVGTKVMERVVGHATGGYTIPAVDISAKTVYTNNIPSGAMRGFGVPQVTFALESCIDDICRQAGFDRWQIRFDNALENGAKTATGQILSGVGLKKCLLAVKDDFISARFAGIAAGLKNTGVGNGMVDDSEVLIKIISGKRVEIHHGWSEMGQGVHTMAIQTLHQETGINPSIVEVIVNTEAGVPTGMTTSSRATALVANALINASAALKADLAEASLEQLAGRTYRGKFVCDWTSKPGAETENPVVHFAYGYAAQVAILDDEGRLRKLVAAHDAGKIMNRMLFEGQIEGALHMGMGYALTEDFPMSEGYPTSYKFNDIGIIRANEMPELKVIGIEEADPVGPYGAKGIGEIGLVPTAAAIANALMAYDGIKRTKLPMRRSRIKDKG